MQSEEYHDGVGGIIETAIGRVFWSYRCDHGEYIELHHLYVASEHRNKGYAKELLKLARRLIEFQFPKLPIRIYAASNSPEIDIERLKNFYKTNGFDLMNAETEESGNDKK